MKYIKKVFNVLLYPFFVVCEKYNEVAAILYSGYLRRKIGNIGKGAVIMPGTCIIGGSNISIGDCSYIGACSVISAWQSYKNQIFTPPHSQIMLGERVSIGEYNHITAINNVQIGNGVLTGKWVTITDNSHGNLIDEIDISPSNRKLYSKGGVIIEDDVWIGDKATILPNVTIGKGAVIGANSVVTKDIPAYCVAVGNPAKIIKELHGNTPVH